MIKKMWLIVKKDGKKFWTSAIEQKEGFLVFNITSKKGKVSRFNLSLDSVDAYSEQEFEHKGLT